MNLEKIKYYAKRGLYYVPGVGLANHVVKEYRTRKGKFPWYNLRETKDRRALGVYAVETAYLVFAISWKIYVGNGIATGDWNPCHILSKDKDMHKKELELKKGSELEKTIQYQEILTVPTENH